MLNRYILLRTSLLHIRQRHLPNIQGIIAIEKLGNLLHGRVSRFHYTEVNNANLEREKDTVADVVLPLQRVKRNTVYELVEEEGGRDAEVEPREALGAEAVGEDLGSVTGHDTRFDVVEDAVEELSEKVSNHSMRGRRMRNLRC
jgi:hypothetical protein